MKPAQRSIYTQYVSRKSGGSEKSTSTGKTQRKSLISMAKTAVVDSKLVKDEPCDEKIEKEKQTVVKKQSQPNIPFNLRRKVWNQNQSNVYEENDSTSDEVEYDESSEVESVHESVIDIMKDDIQSDDTEESICEDSISSVKVNNESVREKKTEVKNDKIKKIEIKKKESKSEKSGRKEVKNGGGDNDDGTNDNNNEVDEGKTKRVEIYRDYTVKLTDVVPGDRLVPMMMNYIFPKCKQSAISALPEGCTSVNTYEYLGYCGIVKTEEPCFKLAQRGYERKDNPDKYKKSFHVGFVMHLEKVGQQGKRRGISRSQTLDVRKVTQCYCYISSGHCISLWKINFDDVENLEMTVEPTGCMCKDPTSDCRVGITTKNTAFEFNIPSTYWENLQDPMCELNEENILLGEKNPNPKVTIGGMCQCEKKESRKGRKIDPFEFGSVCLPVDSSLLFGKKDKMFDCQDKSQYGIVKDTFSVFCAK